MTGKRYLIVNSDDFGLSPGVNSGIIRAYEQGIVTSASLMVRWPSAFEASAYCREHPDFSIGLHVDLGEWIFQDQMWKPLYEVVALEDFKAVEAEVSRQLTLFRNLVGQEPTHIDSHQHVHLREPIRSILIKISRKLGIPLRDFNPEVRYCGDFYGQTVEGLPIHDAINVDKLIQILASLPPGITEIACHPGEGNDLKTMYHRERIKEVATLCDPRVRSAIGRMGMELCSFGSTRHDLIKGTDYDGKAIEKGIKLK